MRILSVDPGEKRIGLAISDPDAVIARPLLVLNHVARALDAATIARIARENGVHIIVVGQALNENGESTPSSRTAARLADALRFQAGLQVDLWDESFSTMDARQALIKTHRTKGRGQNPVDDLAAAVLLQDYLDAHREGRTMHEEAE